MLSILKRFLKWFSGPTRDSIARRGNLSDRDLRKEIRQAVASRPTRWHRSRVVREVLREGPDGDATVRRRRQEVVQMSSRTMRRKRRNVGDGVPRASDCRTLQRSTP